MDIGWVGNQHAHHELNIHIPVIQQPLESPQPKDCNFRNWIVFYIFDNDGKVVIKENSNHLTNRMLYKCDMKGILIHHYNYDINST